MSDKKNQLETVACEAVQRTGLHSLSFRTLADQVGVKSSSVHYYFPEKSDLAAALIEKYSADFIDDLKAIDRRKLNPSKKIDAFVAIFEDVVKAEKFCLCGMLAAEVGLLSADNKSLLNNFFKAVEDWLKDVFEDAKPQLKARVLARSVLSGLEGAILIDRVDGSSLRLKAQKELIRSLL